VESQPVGAGRGERADVTRRYGLAVFAAVLVYGFWQSASFQEIAAGVALFVFGMHCMEQGFRAYTGGALEALLRVATDRLWKSLGFGILTTTLMQSSSLVSVLTISFLSAGMLTLAQGIGIVFGANLGTTTGAWIVAGFGLKVNIGAYALPLVVFGVLMLMQSSKRLRGAGWVAVGLGLLFLGIHYMKTGFESYAGNIDLTEYAVPGVAGLLLYTAIGILATVIMQSSHATLVLIITALGAGQVSYENALALAIGSNVGTTVTAVIGALNANISGKRLAGAHLIFNLVTGVLALAAIGWLVQVVEAISRAVGIAADDYTLKLAVFHTLFNLLGIVLMTPLIGRLVVLLEARLRERRPLRDQPRYLSAAALELPDVALEALIRETRHLFRNAFTLIAHGVNLRRAEIVSELPLEQVVERTGRMIDIDFDDQYDRTIKDVYSANVDFVTRARALAPAEFGDRFQALWQANADVAAAIKAVKHLRKNLLRYSRSNNVHIRDEYNRLRLRIGRVLRQLNSLRDEEAAVAFLSLDDAKVELLEADRHLLKGVDRLIREGMISPQMATSLMNDSGYATELIERLIGMTEALFAAAHPVDDPTRIDLALDPDELETLADRMSTHETPVSEAKTHEDSKAAR
jgi:phosphate:Na+ symporter